jgi:uncharacterized DUF497 family protein
LTLSTTGAIVFSDMNIVWDRNKNEWLILNRGVSFEQIAELLLNGDYLDIIENPTRINQNYFVMWIEEYTWIVPFLINQDDEIVLKTAFPNRKYHARYGGENETR